MKEKILMRSTRNTLATQDMDEIEKYLYYQFFKTRTRLPGKGPGNSRQFFTLIRGSPVHIILFNLVKFDVLFKELYTMKL